MMPLRSQPKADRDAALAFAGIAAALQGQSERALALALAEAAFGFDDPYVVLAFYDLALRHGGGPLAGEFRRQLYRVSVEVSARERREGQAARPADEAAAPAF